MRQSQRWVLAGSLGAIGLREVLHARRAPAPSRCAVLGSVMLETLMLDWHLGMVEDLDGEPRERLSTADALTLGRLALTPFIAVAADRSLFVALLALGGASDLLDGLLARRCGTTRFGRDFDSLADSAFRLAALRCTRRERWIDPSRYRALLTRQALLTGHAVWQWFAHSRRPSAAGSQAARRHVPLLFAGLACGAWGQRRAGDGLVGAAIALAGAHARAPAASERVAADGETPDGTVPQAVWERVSGGYPRQHWLERASLRTAIELLGAREGERLLDVGTGTGEFLRLLARHGGAPREAHGIDRSAAMLANVPPLPVGWSASLGDARATRFADAAFDIASACYLLHVLSRADRGEVLHELARVLRPGGRLVVVTPAIPQRGVGRLLATWLDRLATCGPARLRGLRALDPRPELARAGFEILTARFSRRGYVAICVLARRPVVAPGSPRAEGGAEAPPAAEELAL